MQYAYDRKRAADSKMYEMLLIILLNQILDS